MRISVLGELAQYVQVRLMFLCFNIGTIWCGTVHYGQHPVEHGGHGLVHRGLADRRAALGDQAASVQGRNATPCRTNRTPAPSPDTRPPAGSSSSSSRGRRAAPGSAPACFNVQAAGIAEHHGMNLRRLGEGDVLDDP